VQQTIFQKKMETMDIDAQILLAMERDQDPQEALQREAVQMLKYLYLQLLLEKTSASDMNRYYACYVTWLSAPQRKLDVLLTALT